MPHDLAQHERDIPAQLRAAEAACAQNGTQLTVLRREVLELITARRIRLVNRKGLAVLCG